jgi:enterochelin esterase-like enzyme
MKTSFIFVLVLFAGHLLAQSNTESYPVDPDAEEQAGVPKGEILKFTFANSKIFPGTSREISVYIPAQYKADKPACVYVNQDGIQWKAPTVFDNLIAKNKMPVTIGVFVTPGKVVAQSTRLVIDSTEVLNMMDLAGIMLGFSSMKRFLLSRVRRRLMEER